MISTNATMSELMVETIQQDYITEAERYRFLNSISDSSRKSRWPVGLQKLMSDVKALFVRRQDGRKRFTSEMHPSM